MLPAESGDQLVWSARYVDAAVLRDENNDADDDCIDGDDQRVYYLTDANMNVTALAGDGGTVLERYAYDPYGRCDVLTPAWAGRGASDYDNPIRYAGYYLDAETGLCHVRHRAYHPLLGRWLQRDPLGYVDGMSLYEYVGSMPANSVDPYGLWTWKGVWQGIKKGAVEVGLTVQNIPKAFGQTLASGEPNPGTPYRFSIDAFGCWS